MGKMKKNKRTNNQRINNIARIKIRKQEEKEGRELTREEKIKIRKDVKMKLLKKKGALILASIGIAFYAGGSVKLLNSGDNSQNIKIEKTGEKVKSFSDSLKVKIVEEIKEENDSKDKKEIKKENKKENKNTKSETDTEKVEESNEQEDIDYVDMILKKYNSKADSNFLSRNNLLNN